MNSSGEREVRRGDVNVVVRGGKFPMDGAGLYDVRHADEGPEEGTGAYTARRVG